MDDSRTIRELEELADLFLTEAMEHAQSPGREAHPVAPPKPASTTERLDTAGQAMRDQLSGAASYRFGGSSSAVRFRSELPMNPPQSQPNAARLRLHQPAEGERPRNRPAPPAEVQAVFLGNLPGYAHPWLTQYAHHLARAAGPVAVLHLDDEQVDLDLVGVLDDQTMSRVSVAGDLRATLEALADDPVSPVRQFVIHVAVAPGESAAGLVRGIDRWTLLTGADNTAVIAAYQLLKQMLDSRGAGENPPAPPAVGVMVLGSDEATSVDAGRKIQTTAANFLKLDLKLLGHRKQMLPVQVRHLGSFVFGEAEQTPDAPPGGQWDEALDLLARLGGGAGASGAESSTPPAETPMVSEDERVALTRDEGPQAVGPTVPDNDLAEADRPRPAESDLRPPDSARPRPAQPDLPAVDASSEEEPDLVLFARASGEAPGCIGLEASCPRQTQVRIVLDQGGRMHLLTRQDAGETADRCLARLMHAAAWAREHMELLRLTQRQMHFDRQMEPLLHLFTGQARQAVALTQQAPSQLKIHLLQRVNVGDRATWVCNALN